MRCAAALEEHNALAASPIYKHVKFASICCDLCDGAREILKQTDEPRWSNIDHYFMGFEHKELAKKVLGFKSVPFYVVLNEEGKIVQMGGKKQIDFNNIPGMMRRRAVPGARGCWGEVYWEQQRLIFEKWMVEATVLSETFEDNLLKLLLCDLYCRLPQVLYY